MNHYRYSSALNTFFGDCIDFMETEPSSKSLAVPLPEPTTPYNDYPTTMTFNNPLSDFFDFDFVPPPTQVPKPIVNQPAPKPRYRRAAQKLRYRTLEERLKILIEDPFVQKVDREGNRIQCSRCDKYIKLDNRKKGSVHPQNWLTHRKRCDKNAELVSLSALSVYPWRLILSLLRKKNVVRFGRTWRTSRLYPLPNQNL